MSKALKKGRCILCRFRVDTRNGIEISSGRWQHKDCEAIAWSRKNPELRRPEGMCKRCSGPVYKDDGGLTYSGRWKHDKCKKRR